MVRCALRNAFVVSLGLVAVLAMSGLLGCGASLGAEESSSSSSSSSSGSSSGGAMTGLWSGDNSASAVRHFTELALADGSFYLFYSVAGDSKVLGGVVQGAGTAENGLFVSSSAKDFNFEGSGASVVSLASSYSAGVSQVGKVSNLAGQFTLSYQSDSTVAASLSNLADSYTGSVRSIVTATPTVAKLTINALGVLSGTISYASGECAVSAQLSAKDKISVFGVTNLALSGVTCVTPSSGWNGAAYYRSDIKQLLIAVQNPAMSDSLGFYVKRDN